MENKLVTFYSTYSELYGDIDPFLPHSLLSPLLKSPFSNEEDYELAPTGKPMEYDTEMELLVSLPTPAVTSHQRLQPLNDFSTLDMVETKFYNDVQQEQLLECYLCGSVYHEDSYGKDGDRNSVTCENCIAGIAKDCTHFLTATVVSCNLCNKGDIPYVDVKSCDLCNKHACADCEMLIEHKMCCQDVTVEEEEQYCCNA